MKKTVLVCLVVLFMSVNVFAALGISVKGGVGGNTTNFDDVNEYHLKGNGSKSLSKYDSKIFYSLNVFYEHPAMFGMSEKSLFGIFVGYMDIITNDITSRISDSGTFPSTDVDILLEAKGSAIPFGIYYKYKATRKIAFKTGFGFNYITNTWDYSERKSGISNSKSESAIMPRIDAGIEWTFSNFMSLGFDLAYAFNGKFESDVVNEKIYGNKKFERDYSGIDASLSLNFYILN